MIRLFIPNVHHVRHLSLASNHFLISITLHWRFESSTFGRHPAVKKLQKKQASRHWDHFVKHCLQFNWITKFNSNMNCSDHTWYANKLHPPLGLWPLQQCKSFSSVLLSFSTKKEPDTPVLQSALTSTTKKASVWLRAQSLSQFTYSNIGKTIIR